MLGLPIATFTSLYTFLLLSLRLLSLPPHLPPQLPLLEFPWMCNTLLLISSLHNNPHSNIILARPHLLPAACLTVSIDQLLWYIDLLSYLFTKKFVVGVASYLTWPSTSFARKITSTHHLWSIPLILYQSQINLGGIHSILISYVFTATSATLSRILIPNKILWKGEEVYLNVNLGHEVWKDVNKFTFIRIESRTFWGYLIRLCGKWCGFNTVCYGVMWIFIELGGEIFAK